MYLVLIFTVIVRSVLCVKLVLNTAGCQIPDYKVSFADKPLFASCGKRLVTIKKISPNRIKFNILWQYFDYCCYRYIYRSSIMLKEDEVLNYSPCEKFKDKEKVTLTSDLLLVECGAAGKKVEYRDYYAFVNKINEAYSYSRDNSYNVIMLGMDTMSRKRIYNSMKNTTRYLMKNKWLDFQGYNKIDADTNNIITVLTGKLPHRGFIANCYLNATCNNLMMWTKFKDNGYVTAFAEDAYPYHDTILKIKEDILLSSPIPPTDHYLRPLFKSQQRKTSTMCIGETTTGMQILNYVLDFANTYKRHKFFGFFWLKNFGQEIWQSPRTLDVKLTMFFSKLKMTGVLKNTFVIFFSDHGLRHGKVRYNVQAFYEERLPMLFMHIPRIFKKHYPDHFFQLKHNQQRLISPYDLHLTVLNILEPHNTFYSNSEHCKTCLSLFQWIPHSRSCSDAGIDDIWCTCHFLLKTSVKNEIGALVSVVKSFSFIQNVSNDVPVQLCSRCQLFKIKNVLRTHVFNYNNTYYYIASFLVQGGVVFEVIVKRSLVDGAFSYNTVRYDVISEYTNTGRCVLDYKNRKFCLCKKDKNRCEPPEPPTIVDRFSLDIINIIKNLPPIYH